MTTAISCAGVDYLDADYLAEELEVCTLAAYNKPAVKNWQKKISCCLILETYFLREQSAKHSDEYMTSPVQRPDKSHPTYHQFSGPVPSLLSVAILPAAVVSGRQEEVSTASLWSSLS